MRWFKHMSAAHCDVEMDRLLEEHGPVIIGVYWLILEDIAMPMEAGRMEPSATHSDAKWAQIVRLDPRVWRRCKQSLAQKLLSISTTPDNRVIISAPNLLKYRDEYSKKSGVAPENVRTRTDTDTEQIQSREEKPICAPDGAQAFLLEPPTNGNGHAKPLKEQEHPNFSAFWDLRWRTDDRKAAEKSFRKALDTVSVETIMAAVAREKPRQMAKEAQYRPMMSTWLNKRRFLDEAEPEQLANPGERTVYKYV